MSPLLLFEEKQVRRAWNKAEDKWYLAIVDVIGVLTSSVDPQVYQRVMKKRLIDKGNQTVTNCHGLKMTDDNGKQRLTDVADLDDVIGQLMTPLCLAPRQCEEIAPGVRLFAGALEKFKLNVYFTINSEGVLRVHSIHHQAMAVAP